MNNKKEGEFYYQMVRKYYNEYGGKNLKEFCIKEKVSYSKMLNCLQYDYHHEMNKNQLVPQTSNPGLVKSGDEQGIRNDGSYGINEEIA